MIRQRFRTNSLTKPLHRKGGILIAEAGGFLPVGAWIVGEFAELVFEVAEASFSKVLNFGKACYPGGFSELSQTMVYDSLVIRK